MLDHAPADSRLAFLPAVPISQFLQRLEQCDFDVFDPSLRQRRPMLPVTLLKHRMNGTF